MIAYHLGFPFNIDKSGHVNATSGEEAIRGKIIQVLFTTPGERVNLPEFGCGLFNLVFEPNDAVLTAAMEFTVGQALNRWLEEDIIVEGVKAKNSAEVSDIPEGALIIEIVYTNKHTLTKQAVRIQFKA